MTGEHGTVDVRHEGGVRFVTLRRPPVNALTMVEYERLARAFRVAPDDAERARIIVLEASGRAFCAGQDRTELAGLAPGELAGYLRRAGRAVASAARCPVPIVSVVTGPAVGAGGLLVAVSDSVLMADDGWLAFPEARMGVPVGGTILASFVPPTTARHLLLTGERIGAGRLFEIGAVARTVAAGDVAAARDGMVEDLLALPDAALRWVRGIGDRAARAHEYEAEIQHAIEAHAGGRLGVCAGG